MKQFSEQKQQKGWNSDDKVKKRPKRSGGAPVTKTNGQEKKATQNSGSLKRTNVASALLGLSILLYPDKNGYDGVALNSFYGFRVSS